MLFQVLSISLLTYDLFLDILKQQKCTKEEYDSQKYAEIQIVKTEHLRVDGLSQETENGRLSFDPLPRLAGWGGNTGTSQALTTSFLQLLLTYFSSLLSCFWACRKNVQSLLKLLMSRSKFLTHFFIPQRDQISSSTEDQDQETARSRPPSPPAWVDQDGLKPLIVLPFMSKVTHYCNLH